MYIRWVVRKHKNAEIAAVTFHDAYLVESFRDDENNPRQRTICYLGNIRQIGDEFPMIERELFLLRADRILASVPEVTEREYPQVLAQLRQKVPALTCDEVRLAFANNLNWYRQWWVQNGGAPSRDELLAMLDGSGEIEPM